MSADDGTAPPTRGQVKAALDFVLATSASLARCDPFHGADSDNVSDRTIENFGRLGTRLMEARKTLRLALLSRSAATPQATPGQVLAIGGLLAAWDEPSTDDYPTHEEYLQTLVGLIEPWIESLRPVAAPTGQEEGPSDR